MKNLKASTWTDPYGLNAANAQVFLYFFRVVDDEGYEFRYIGQTRSGKLRLAQYAQNIQRIIGGLPEGTSLAKRLIVRSTLRWPRHANVDGSTNSIHSSKLNLTE